MASNEASSMLVSRILDHLGYDLPTVQLRQNVYDQLKEERDGFYCLLAGSKAEGISKLLESDIDALFVMKDIVSTTNHQHVGHWENVSLFTLDMTGTPSGYTRLECERLSHHRDEQMIDSLTEPILGKVYLSSDFWREEYRKLLTGSPSDDLDVNILRYSQGPSNPVRFQGISDYDMVCGIICDCPEILQSWIDRPREYEWPPVDVIREISTMEAHVVPIGYKGSPFQFLEWRICFTKAEIRLIKSFNDCQIKLLVLLKWVAKHCLKPLCKEMTSYVMKNLVMWSVEKLPPSYFLEQGLLNTLMTLLKCLKTCLFKGRMPNYMIPERNLFADRLTFRQRSRLCMKIDILVHEGPQLVLRCDKIRTAVSMITTCGPETFFSFCQTGNTLECVCLWSNLEKLKGDGQDEMFSVLVAMCLLLVGKIPLDLLSDERFVNALLKFYLL